MAKFDPHDKTSIIYACLIPVLVLLSGLFAGLTLGYMSLDTTQLNVLSISGTPYVISVCSLFTCANNSPSQHAAGVREKDNAH